MYTDNLWFSSLGIHRVWSTLIAVKVGLFASFGAAFFVGLWVNLVVCDRLAARTPTPVVDDELVTHYQRTVRPYAGRVYALLAVAAALIAGATTIGQWNDWLLFTHAKSFPGKDPVFGMNIGFFVFRLPFFQFLVDWVLASLVVIFLFTTAFHYLNGGIRMRATPRVQPLVKVHLSVLLALMALVKAAGYVLSRYELDMSTNGYVEGAGYADVHARLPALALLFFVSLFAAVILLYNVRRQGWTLPVLAVGVWAVVALVVGVIYPAVLQAFRVNPAQSTYEKPYITRNIRATRAAYGLDRISVSKDPDDTKVPTATVDADLTTLDNIRVWDPNTTIAKAEFKAKQDISSYYTFPAVQVERYSSGGTIHPDIVGVRQVDPTDVLAKSWVNTHLQYTHGDGFVLAPANRATSNGNPVFSIRDVPTTSAKGFPKVRQPEVYFGMGEPGYVVADTKQSELEALTGTGSELEGHYAGDGGVKLSSLFTKAAFALRFGDLNLVLSNLLTPTSKMMFVRNVRTMAQKAAPFLRYDAQPYPALVNGQINWILNGYTTTSNYPYSQNAQSQDVPNGDSIPGSYNYIRNSVEVVVNAYTGKMTLYTMDPGTPILRAYTSAFPHLFTPSSDMSPSLRAQLRYGTDLFAVQAAFYGRYHITSPSAFYSAGDAWIVSPTTGVGSPNQTLRFSPVFTHGELVGGSYQPMTPVFQVLALPGETTQSFTLSDVFVPATGSGNASSKLLRGILIGDSDPGEFGQLHVYETPPGASKIGSIYADSEIEGTPTVSKTVTLLDKTGSRVLFGNILPIPVGKSVLYVRPLYVESRAVEVPQVKEVIAVLGQHVEMRKTLGATLNALLGTHLKITHGLLTRTPSGTPTGTPTVTTSGSSSPSTSSPNVRDARTLLAQASSDFAAAQTDLKAGTLAGYAREVADAQQAAEKAERLLGETAAGSSAGGAAGPSGSTPQGSSDTSGATGSSGSGASNTNSTAHRTSSTSTGATGAGSTGAGPSSTTRTNET
ncbi:MAG: UPF0182 family protein, partial [Acidimicrobiales bacterium]